MPSFIICVMHENVLHKLFILRMFISETLTNKESIIEFVENNIFNSLIFFFFILPYFIQKYCKL